MYMRVTRGRWPDLAKLDTEAGRQVLQDLVAAVTGCRGNQSYMGGVNRASGQTVAVSTWDTEEHARFSLDAVGDVPSRLQALGLQLEPSEFFEVTTPGLTARGGASGAEAFRAGETTAPVGAVKPP